MRPVAHLKMGMICQEREAILLDRLRKWPTDEPLIAALRGLNFV